MQPQHGIGTTKPPLPKNENANDRCACPYDVRDQDHDAEEHPRGSHGASYVAFTGSAGRDGSPNRFEHADDDQHTHDAVQPEHFIERKTKFYHGVREPREQE